MRIVNIHAAKTHLSKLIEEVAAGEEILIAKAGKPMARLVPLQPADDRPKRVLGRLRGKINIPDSFDDPLPEDTLRLFEGGDQR